MKISKTSLASFFSWEVLFVLTVTVLTACLYFLSVRFIELVELKAWDLHFRERGVVAPSGKVAFVTVDEESVNRDGRWPWPRRQMAQLLTAIESYGARVVGLDMGFFEPDLKLRQQAILDLRDKFQADPTRQGLVSELEALSDREDDDLILADTLKKLHIPFVLGHFFYFDEKAFFPPPPSEAFMDKAKCGIVQMERKDQEPPLGRLHDAVGLETNIPAIETASQLTGSFNVVLDPDGSVRWMPLVVRYQKRLFPSLALQMMAAAFPQSPLVIKEDRRGIKEIRLGETIIPTNDKGDILLNYYGPSYTFPHFSATALLHHEAPADCLKDRIVVVGNTTMGLFDMRATPFSSVFPGVELHCVVMENIAQKQFLRQSERMAPYYDLAMLFGLALVFLVLQSFLRGILLNSVGVIVLLGGYLALTHYAFLNEGLWLNHIYPSLNLIVCYAGTSIYRYMKEEREKRMVRQTFSLYVPGSVVEEMLAHPELLRLGGEKKELTVFFSDIRGFTTLSEQLPAEELVPQLNEYLTRMTQVVFDHEGTLDKYIGDAIMGIFGAPLFQNDHSYRACSTALDMVKTLHTLHKEWQAQGKPVLHIGIGVNTGMMMVGNMGSERRFDYTVLGDNVNLASRLEGLTKKYGVTIVVSETTWEAAKDRFVGRELDVVRVKGKQNPVAIFELLDRAQESGLYREPLEVYQEALLEFRRKNWQKALELFQRVQDWWPDDAPSLLYQKRCRELLQNHPGEDWSFVTVLDSK